VPGSLPTAVHVARSENARSGGGEEPPAVAETERWEDEGGAITGRPRRPRRGERRVATQGFSGDEARQVGEDRIDWATASFDLEQFRRGMDVKLEHGLRRPRTNVSDDDPVESVVSAITVMLVAARSVNLFK
jgi:hypothetical protein